MVQPATGFHVTSVHSIFDIRIILMALGKEHAENMAVLHRLSHFHFLTARRSDNGWAEADVSQASEERPLRNENGSENRTVQPSFPLCAASELSRATSLRQAKSWEGGWM
jgi:hypothetical protein